MNCQQSVLTTPDGTRLFVRAFQPTRPPASRSLLIVHGLGEHSQRYEHVIPLFVERGWEVIAGDLRGHGHSDGIHSHVDEFQHYVEDVEQIRQHFQLPANRLALLGHSMGGLVAIRYAQTFLDRLSALVLLSPLLRLAVPIHPVTIALARVASVFVPQLRFRTRVQPSDVTRDLEALQRRANDPLLRRSVTAGWYFAMQKALQPAWNDAPQIRVPVLLMQGGHDRVVDPTAAEPWLEQVGSQDKTFHLLPEHLHELLNESDWKATTRRILHWLDERLAPADSSRTAIA